MILTSIAILVGWLSMIVNHAQQKVVPDGRYIVSYPLSPIENQVVGFLILYSGNYSFEFDRNYKKSENTQVVYPPFCITYPSGRFTSSYSIKVSDSTDWRTLSNHASIFHIRLYSNEKEIYGSLIRLDKEKGLYFHSVSNKKQFWKIERPNSSGNKITTVDAFVKSCEQECSASPLRYKSNISGNPEPIDQCSLIRHYADMVFNESENAYGAKLILKDVCPQAIISVK